MGSNGCVDGSPPKLSLSIFDLLAHFFLVLSSAWLCLAQVSLQERLGTIREEP